MIYEKLTQRFPLGSTPAQNDQNGIAQEQESKNQNFQFLFGCRPSKTVRSDTQMVDEIADTFDTYFDKNQLTLKFPDVFAQMINNDANIELVVSNTLQPMNLIMSANQIKKESVAHIFINPESLGHKYEDVETKAKDAVTLFQDILGFVNIEYHIDKTSEEIVKILEEAKKKAKEFETQQKKDREEFR